MQLKDTIHSFTVEEIREIPEVEAVLYKMRHQKTKAELIWLDREDDNKTFAIAFKTIPEDDTGVFHILEHSVLNGSDKYPVKEPFMELVKSSLQTFLNAFTYPDKTVYPFCTRNDQDYMNLMRVYLDAVFHPLSIHTPEAFLQEGWHYEFEEDGTSFVNGVVYNEMKGSYDSEETILRAELDRQLFPDTCYRFESGGDPKAIPTLSYEQYCEAHRRFYHPSNARIFLDGKLDLEAVLGELEKVLLPYDYRDPQTEIPLQKPVQPAEKTVYYSPQSADDPERQVLLGGAFMAGRCDELEKGIALSLINDYLCDSNLAPLKKAVLDRGLAEDINLYYEDGILQNYVSLEVRNTSLEDSGKVWEVFYQVLEEECRRGLKKDKLVSLLNRYEYSAREKDYGTMPRGLVFGLDLLDTWLYDLDPEMNLCYEKLYPGLREKIKTDYFEKLIGEVFLKNNHTARIKMVPSETIQQEELEREEKRLERLSAGWTKVQRSELESQAERLRIYQQTEDTPEALSTIPRLKLSDVNEKIHSTEEKKTIHAGARILQPQIATRGILYEDLYFEVSDLPQESMSLLSLMCTYLGNLPVGEKTTEQLQQEMDLVLGHFRAEPAVFQDPDHPETCRVYFAVHFSMLERYAAEAEKLVLEILTDTRFDELHQVSVLLRQERSQLQRQILSSGNSYAVRFASAQLRAASAVSDAFGGISFYRYLKEADQNFSSEGPQLCLQMAEISKKAVRRNRLLLNVTGNSGEDRLHAFLEQIPEGEVGGERTFLPLKERKTAFEIAAEVGYAGAALDLRESGDLSASCLVAAQILSLDYLWNQIRVAGGAYGAGMRSSMDGLTVFSSYRDPDVLGSLQAIRGSAEALESMIGENLDLTPYIISTIAESEPVLTPRLLSLQCALRELGSITPEQRQKNRSKILHTTGEDLHEFAVMLKKHTGQEISCVISGKASLEKMSPFFDRIEKI